MLSPVNFLKIHKILPNFPGFSGFIDLPSWPMMISTWTIDAEGLHTWLTFALDLPYVPPLVSWNFVFTYVPDHFLLVLLSYVILANNFGCFISLLVHVLSGFFCRYETAFFVVLFCLTTVILAPFAWKRRFGVWHYLLTAYSKRELYVNMHKIF